MSGHKVLIVGIFTVAGIALAISAIVALATAVVGLLVTIGPPVIMIVGVFAIARWLVRKSPKRIQKRILHSLGEPAKHD